MGPSLRNPTDCCGCGACVAVCPVKAIVMTGDEYGFLYPEVTQSLCIDCSKCTDVCPAIAPDDSRVSQAMVYSLYANDEAIREQGSSGGVFGMLAHQVLAEGGVVFGAAFDRNLQLRHTGAESLEQLAPIFKSKYLQSDTRNTFFSVKKFLGRQRKVLFCGTPCQCEALYNFLGRDIPDNLFLIDFICHGVPSQKFFDKSVLSHEIKQKKKVRSFVFRKKSTTAKTEKGLHYFQIGYSDGSSEAKQPWDFPFYAGYLKYLFFRPSCYKCTFAKINRVSDLTLGDFWGLRQLERINDFNKGYSMVIVNSKRGNDIIRQLDGTAKEYPLQVAIDNNFAYTHPTIQTSESQSFFNDYHTLSWRALERKYMTIRTDLFHRGIRFLKRKIAHVFS